MDRIEIDTVDDDRLSKRKRSNNDIFSTTWNELYITSFMNMNKIINPAEKIGNAQDKFLEDQLELLVVEIFVRISGENIEFDIINRLIHEIRLKYRNNQYHNFEHAAHVTLNVAYLLQNIKKSSIEASSVNHITPIEKLALLYSAIIHDMEHFGVPNETLINQSHELAIKFHDQSVAEMNSLTIGLELISNPIHNCMLLSKYSENDKKIFRKSVIELVLCTDIADPFKKLSAFHKLESHQSVSGLSKVVDNIKNGNDSYPNGHHLNNSNGNDVSKLSDNGNLITHFVPRELLVENSSETEIISIHNMSSIVSRLSLFTLLLRIADVGAGMQSKETFLIWSNKFYNELTIATGGNLLDRQRFYNDQIRHAEMYLSDVVQRLVKCDVVDELLVENIKSNLAQNIADWKVNGLLILQLWEENFNNYYRTEKN
eukprot:gene12990-17419_t